MSVKLNYQKNKGGVKSYYLHVNENGRRTKEFLGIKVSPKDTKTQKDEKLRTAKILRDKRDLELLSGNTGVISLELKNKRFKAFTDNYLKTYTKKDINTVRASINTFYDVAGQEIKLANITSALMQKFMDKLNNSHLTGETPHSYWNRFKKVLRKAKTEGYIREMPTVELPFKTVQPKNLRKQILDIDDLKILKDTYCGNNEVKRAFLFACFTGLGMAEIRELRWNNIHKGRLQTVRQKTGIPIDTKLSPTALEMIGQHGHKNDYVFDIYISDTAVNKNIRNWVKLAELDKDITFYCARHTFAVMALRNIDLKTVADLMGHKDIKTTTRYLNYITDLKDKGIDNLPHI